jgi:hypothetical protein
MAYDIAMLLNDWQTMGVFNYVLPFLLIFAFVYGILSATRVFSGNKSVNVIMALSIGLLSLQFDYVPLFFSEVFPRFGVGIAVFLVLTILTALFIPTKYFKGWGIGFTIIGVLIGAIVIYKAFERLGWLGGTYWWDEYGSLIILVIGIAVIVTVFLIQKTPADTTPTEHKPWRGVEE